LTLHEVHEASSIIQKAAHENANIIFGAVQDESMKDSVKITVIAAGFKDANKKNVAKRPEFLPKTWKAGREVPVATAAAAGAGSASNSTSSTTNEQPTVVHQVQQNVREVAQDVPADDLDVPTFLRRQAQKA
jgi:cell division protein FtsZ